MRYLFSYFINFFSPNVIVGVSVCLLHFLPSALLHVNFLLCCVGIETVIDRLPIFLFDISAFLFLLCFLSQLQYIFIGGGGDSFVRKKLKLL